MTDRKIVEATHQSWTGAVSIYLPKPPRIALYPGHSDPGSAVAAAAGNDHAVLDGPGASSAPAPVAQSQSLVPHPAGPPPFLPQLLPQRQALPSAPNKAGLRGTWLLSRGSAVLTAALSAEGQGEFDVKVQLEGTVLWHQDLFAGGGTLRLLASPAPIGCSTGVDTAAGRSSATVPAAALTASAAAAGSSADNPSPWLLLLLPPLTPAASTGQSAAAGGPDDQVAAGQVSGARLSVQSGGMQAVHDLQQPPALGAPQLLLQSHSQPPAALCFRFNSAGEGRAFRSLMEVAERARQSVVQRAAEQGRHLREEQERRRARQQARQESERLRQQQRQRKLELAAERAGELSPGSRGEATPSALSEHDIRAAIERYLLEPDFQELVARVETVWEAMEEQAERQLAAAAEGGGQLGSRD